MVAIKENVGTLEQQLDELSNVFDSIKNAFTTEHHKRHHLASTKEPPKWMEDVTRHLEQILAELRSVKETLNARLFTDRNHSQSDASATNGTVLAAEFQHGGSSYRESEIQQVFPGLINGQQEPIATNVCKPPAPSKPNVIAQELASLQQESVQPRNPQAHANGVLLRPPVEAGHVDLSNEGPLSEVHKNTRNCLLKRANVMNLEPISMKRKASLSAPQSRQPLLTPYMGSLLEAICGKEAFHHMCYLIRSWRDRSKPLFAVNNDRPAAMQLVNAINGLGERSLLVTFLGRLARVKLAEVIDDGKVDRLSADPTAITNLISGLKWEDNKKNRNRLHNYLKDGRKWKKICGKLDGLLCLIPPNREDKENPRKASGRMYQELSDKDIQVLHSELDSNQFISSMCRMGNSFQVSVWTNMEVPEFRWESEDSKKLARLPMDKLALLMEEFQLIEANVWDFEKYNWPKPDCWQWDWPRHPTWVAPSDKLCDLCDLCEIDKICNCITTCLPQHMPRITNEAAKGQGVRVIDMTYQKDQILGEFLGELVPLDTYHNGWPIEFRRPDLGDEPIAQIYPGDMGNWVRKVNHSCAPSAEFRVMKISGWWRQMIVAIRDIPHNGEITASCGLNFLRGQRKECFCEICNENLRLC